MSGRMVLHHHRLDDDLAVRRVVTLTQSLSSMPSFAASRGWISSLRLRILLDERPDAAGLRPGEIHG